MKAEPMNIKVEIKITHPKGYNTTTFFHANMERITDQSHFEVDLAEAIEQVSAHVNEQIGRWQTTGATFGDE